MEQTDSRWLVALRRDMLEITESINMLMNHLAADSLARIETDPARPERTLTLPSITDMPAEIRLRTNSGQAVRFRTIRPMGR